MNILAATQASTGLARELRSVGRRVGCTVGPSAFLRFRELRHAFFRSFICFLFFIFLLNLTESCCFFFFACKCSVSSGRVFWSLVRCSKWGVMWLVRKKVSGVRFKRCDYIYRVVVSFAFRMAALLWHSVETLLSASRTAYA